jgi:F0F1-type ATP synthase membrane subunit b/b'
VQSLVADYEQKLREMKAMYEAMLASLAAEKDSEREKLRAQMQGVIDDLKR